jgi:cytochrome c oxidase subunit II
LAVLAISAHDTAGQFAGLWHIYLGVLLTVGILVTGAILVAAVRFRGRPGRDPRDLRSAPKLEAAYLSVIVVIVICLLAFTYRTENQVDAVTAHPAVRVDVTASQWQWRFRYPAAGIVMTARDVGSPHPHFAHLIVPAGRPVEFSLRSADVLHSFFIPEMRFKRYAYGNYTNRFVLTFPHPGRMLGECAQLCGWDHAEMRFDVDVLSLSRFRAWIAAHRTVG